MVDINVKREMEDEYKEIFPKINLNILMVFIIIKMYLMLGLLTYLVLFKLGELQIDETIVLNNLKLFMNIAIAEMLIVIFQLFSPIIYNGYIWIKKKIKGRKKYGTT